MKYRLLAILAIMTALSLGSTVYAQSEEMAAIKNQVQAIKHIEAEIRIPAIYTVKSIGASSEHSQVKLAVPKTKVFAENPDRDAVISEAGAVPGQVNGTSNLIGFVDLRPGVGSDRFVLVPQGEGANPLLKGGQA